MKIIDRINKRLQPWGLTAEDLTEEELSEAKRCLNPNIIDGFFSSDTLLRKSSMKMMERCKNSTK